MKWANVEPRENSLSLRCLKNEKLCTNLFELRQYFKALSTGCCSCHIKDKMFPALLFFCLKWNDLLITYFLSLWLTNKSRWNFFQANEYKLQKNTHRIKHLLSCQLKFTDNPNRHASCVSEACSLFDFLDLGWNNKTWFCKFAYVLRHKIWKTK